MPSLKAFGPRIGCMEDRPIFKLLTERPSPAATTVGQGVIAFDIKAS